MCIVYYVLRQFFDKLMYMLKTTVKVNILIITIRANNNKQN